MKKKSPKPTLAQQYQQSLDVRDRAEKKLIRAHNAWVKSGQNMRRLERRLDLQDEANRNEIAGKLDVREPLQPTKPELLQKKPKKPTKAKGPPTPSLSVGR